MIESYNIIGIFIAGFLFGLIFSWSLRRHHSIPDYTIKDKDDTIERLTTENKDLNKFVLELMAGKQ